MIHRGDPLTDDRLKLIEEEERVIFWLLPAGEDVGPLVSRQRLQQVFAQRAEEALHRPLIPSRAQPRRLDGDAHPGTDTGQVLRDVYLTVVDNNGLRYDRRAGQAWPLELFDIDQDRARDAVLWPDRMPRPMRLCRTRPERLIKHGGGVHRLGRHGGEPQPGDAACIPVHSYGQFGLHPFQGERVAREHVQPRGVHQQVLTRPRGPQLAVDLLRAIRDIPIAFRTQPEGWVPTFQLLQQSERCGTTRLSDHLRAEPGDYSCPSPLDDHRARRLGLPGVLRHHL